MNFQHDSVSKFSEILLHATSLICIYFDEEKNIRSSQILPLMAQYKFLISTDVRHPCFQSRRLLMLVRILRWHGEEAFVKRLERRWAAFHYVGCSRLEVTWRMDPVMFQASVIHNHLRKNFFALSLKTSGIDISARKGRLFRVVIRWS